MKQRRHRLKETVAWCICLPAAAVPFNLLAALALLFVGLVVTMWR